MENRKGLNFFFLIIAIILLSALYKQFDFESYKFQNPVLAILYIIVLAASIYFIIKDLRKHPNKE